MKSLPPTSNSSPFSLRDVITVLAFILAVLLLVQYNILPLRSWMETWALPRSVLLLLLFLLQEAILLLPVLSLIRFRYKTSFFRSFSLQKIPFWQGFRKVCKWYVYYIVFSVVLSALMIAFDFHIPGYGEGQDLLPLFGTSVFSKVVFAIIAIGIAPIAEELFFRGFLFCTLLKTNGYLVATITTSLIFASVHLDFNAFFPRFILGLILNQLVMENRRTIGPSIMFHVLNNGVALIMQFVLIT